MSLRKKILVIALGSALVMIVGRTLTPATFQNAVSAMASAVWGS